jgi:hypothetical protein
MNRDFVAEDPHIDAHGWLRVWATLKELPWKSALKIVAVAVVVAVIG